MQPPQPQHWRWISHAPPRRDVAISRVVAITLYCHARNLVRSTRTDANSHRGRVNCPASLNCCLQLCAFITYSDTQLQVIPALCCSARSPPRNVISSAAAPPASPRRRSPLWTPLVPPREILRSTSLSLSLSLSSLSRRLVAVTSSPTKAETIPDIRIQHTAPRASFALRFGRVGGGSAAATAVAKPKTVSKEATSIP